MKHLLIIALCLLPTAVPAQSIELSWPLSCHYGEDCFIQNYVDEDSTKAARDFTCGPLTYDGHKGTDIRVKNTYIMRQGITILAAADGTVRGVRDGMDDVSVKIIGLEAVKNRECGNGVVLDHPAGFETQYCHMMKGSILVKQGQKIKAGQPLGRIGMSGASEFPHLHLEVRRLGRVIDPFTANIAGGSCGKSNANLWKNDVNYIPTALLGHGFAAVVPTAEQVRDAAPVTQIDRTMPAVVYWVDLMGVRQDDVLTLNLIGPNGQVVATRDVPLTRNLAQTFSFVGKKATEEGLVPGAYKANFTLTRKGQDTPVLQGETQLDVPF